MLHIHKKDSWTALVLRQNATAPLTQTAGDLLAAGNASLSIDNEVHVLEGSSGHRGYCERAAKPSRDATPVTTRATGESVESKCARLLEQNRTLASAAPTATPVTATPKPIVEQRQAPPFKPTKLLAGASAAARAARNGDSRTPTASLRSLAKPNSTPARSAPATSSRPSKLLAKAQEVARNARGNH
jgi:hypothetical protein